MKFLFFEYLRESLDSLLLNLIEGLLFFYQPPFNHAFDDYRDAHLLQFFVFLCLVIIIVIIVFNVVASIGLLAACYKEHALNAK